MHSRLACRTSVLLALHKHSVAVLPTVQGLQTALAVLYLVRDAAHATCDELLAGCTSRGMGQQSKRPQHSSCRAALRGADIEVVDDADFVLRWSHDV